MSTQKHDHDCPLNDNRGMSDRPDHCTCRKPKPTDDRPPAKPTGRRYDSVPEMMRGEGVSEEVQRKVEELKNADDAGEGLLPCEHCGSTHPLMFCRVCKGRSARVPDAPIIVTANHHRIFLEAKEAYTKEYENPVMSLDSRVDRAMLAAATIIAKYTTAPSEGETVGYAVIFPGSSPLFATTKTTALEYGAKAIIREVIYKNDTDLAAHLKPPTE